MNWPPKVEHNPGCLSFKANKTWCDCGAKNHNDAIDACKKAWEESPKLIPIGMVQEIVSEAHLRMVALDERKLKIIIKYQIEARKGEINPKDDFNGFIYDIKNCLTYSIKQQSLPALTSPLNCTHANEVPSVCKCPEDCYCKRNTCEPSPALTVEEIVRIITDNYATCDDGEETKEWYCPVCAHKVAQAIYNRLKGEK